MAVASGLLISGSQVRALLRPPWVAVDCTKIAHKIKIIYKFFGFCFLAAQPTGHPARSLVTLRSLKGSSFSGIPLVLSARQRFARCRICGALTQAGSARGPSI